MSFSQAHVQLSEAGVVPSFGTIKENKSVAFRQTIFPVALAPIERKVEGMSRDEVAHRYQGKILLIARQLSERLPAESSVQYEDLVSYGAIGLLEAFERYDRLVESRSRHSPSTGSARRADAPGAMTPSLVAVASWRKYRGGR